MKRNRSSDERRNELITLLALATVPLGCTAVPDNNAGELLGATKGDDSGSPGRNTGAASSGADTHGSTSSLTTSTVDGGGTTTGGTATDASTTTGLPTTTGSPTTTDSPTTTGFPTTGFPTTGFPTTTGGSDEPSPACVAFGELYGDCYGPQYAADGQLMCEWVLTLNAANGPECVAAYEDYYACLSELACGELIGPSACEAEAIAAEGLCS